MSPTIIKCEKCGRVVCNACYCEWTPESVVTIPIVAKPFDPTIDLYHALWLELHTEVRTKEQFSIWLTKVPAINCECLAWLKDYLAKCPPPDGDLAEYGFLLHQAVNRKLGKAEFTWAEFEAKYGAN